MDDPSKLHILHPDTQAVLLLCGRLGRLREGDARPLTQSEYNNLAEWLRENGMRPAELLTEEGLGRAESAGEALPVSIPRLRLLLQRGGPLALAVESWSNVGLWVISRSDKLYPRRFRVGRLGPPILYGVGNKELLSAGGLVLVGSRDVSDEALDFTRRVARACAEQGIQVISGGARGVDTEAMLAAVEAGGTSVGVLADSLTKAAVTAKYREALMEGRMALCSPYDPGAGFDVGIAMGRNKLIYGLADWALIVSSGRGNGGTWAGAVEALKSGNIPVFVRTEGTANGVPEGNRELLKRRASPFPPEPWTDLAVQLSAPAQFLATSLHQINHGKQAAVPGLPAASNARSTPRRRRRPDTAYAEALPLLLEYLNRPQDPQSIAEALDIPHAQLKRWLKRAEEEGHIAKASKRPVRYVVAPPHLDL